jgi:hypothetical protein
MFHVDPKSFDPLIDLLADLLIEDLEREKDAEEIPRRNDPGRPAAIPRPPP